MSALNTLDRTRPEIAPAVRPRVLFVGAGEPWTRSAGYLVRQSMFLDALRELAEVQLALFAVDDDVQWSPTGESVAPLPMPERYPNTDGIANFIKDCLSSVPSLYLWDDHDEALQRVAKLRPDEFDAVFAYRIDFAYFAGVHEHARLLLDIDDPEHLRRRERYRLHSHKRFEWHAPFDLARLARFERRMARRAAASFVCQPNDQKAFDEPRPMIVPNCVDAPDTLPQRVDHSSTLLFVGNLQGHRESPNVDGLLWFVQQVWPQVRSQSGCCRLRIAGPISDALKRELQGLEGIEIAGFVPQLRDELQRAAGTIAPIRFGTGTRIKILESLAWGCPVVSTTKGAEGLEVAHDQHLLVGDEPQAFAFECVRLLNDARLQAKLGAAGHARVLEKYERRRQHPRLVRILGEILAHVAPNRL